MDGFNLDEKNFRRENSQSAGRRGGPTTPQGKATSSLNRLTHGCRSEKTVLPFEDPEEWAFTLGSWMDSYNAQAHTPSGAPAARLDEDPTAATLVFEAARAQWVFQRNQNRLDEIESALPSDAIEWTPDHHKQYSNFLRYKTTAERSFHRAFNALETHYKRRHDKAVAIEKARAQMGKIQMHWLRQKNADAIARQLGAIQYVEVSTVSSGECVTSYAPTNQQLAEMLADRTRLAEKQNTPLPQYVTRYIHFSNGVPPAYEWLHPNDIQRYRSCMGVQHFTYQDWRLQLEAEELAATGHLQPFTTGVLME